ncbi:MAG: hypothetical protein EAZ57_04920 [Cytophagales bacterium]|nr:MAG: hypothetical protein EAZ67_00960 [Cytophagales bacterium]TAF61135.1 MAG: hypothetical protein EAZ57_04920 [Cytophagales bacterium]
MIGNINKARTAFKLTLCFLLLVLTVHNSVLAQDEVIQFSSKDALFPIGQQIYLLEDKEGKLNINDIQKPEYQKLFKKSEQDIPNFNSTKSTIWVKFTVANTSQEKIYVEVAQAVAWYIDFYKPDTTGKLVLITQTGMMRPMKNREVDNNFFLFELAKNPKSQTYYFSIQSDFPLVIPLTIANKKALMEKSNAYHLFFGVFSGLMLIMLFYNFFLFFSFRDRLYLYYCFYLLATLFIINFISGNYAYKLNLISYVSQYFIVFVWLGSVSIALFIIILLQVSRKQIFYKILSVWVVLNFMFSLFNLITGHYIQIADFVQGIMLLVYVYILVYAIYHYLKGNSQARFVVYGFAFYLIAVIIYLVQNFGLIPTNFFTANAIVFGASIEVLMFSLALTDRINTMRREKELAQNSLLEKTKENERILAEQNLLLEHKVQERTESLQVSNEELQQTQEEIMAQRDTLEAKNRLLGEYSHRISKSIEAAQTIQTSILPSESKMKQLFSENFVLFLPKDVVSGDFWWVTEVSGKKFLAVADCTGHGVSGALLTMIGIGLLDRIVMVLGVTEPAQILEKLHQEIQLVLQQNKNAEGMDIAIAKWHEEDNKVVLNFSAAKRPLYYTDGHAIKKLSGTRRSVGGLSKKHMAFESQHLILTKNTCIYLCSDGLADQNSPTRQNFTVNRVLALLNSIRTEPLAQQKQAVAQALNNHQKNMEQRDDILVVGIKL